MPLVWACRVHVLAHGVFDAQTCAVLAHHSCTGNRIPFRIPCRSVQSNRTTSNVGNFVYEVSVAMTSLPNSDCAKGRAN